MNKVVLHSRYLYRFYSRAKGAILLLFLIGFHSCGNQDGTIKLKKSLKSTSLSSELSNFCMPIEISLIDLQQKINERVKHNLVVNQEGENKVLLNVERAGLITLRGYHQKQVLITLPLKITARKGLKVNLFSTDFEIDVQILTDVNINRNWNVTADSRIHKIIWRENPEISFLGIDIDIKDMVEKAVDEKRPEIAQRVDESISEKIDLKRHLNRVWFRLQKPHNLVKRSGEEFYLFIEPNSVSYIDHKIFDDHFLVDIKSDALFTAVSSYNPEEDKRSGLPKLNKDNKPCEGFNINLLTELKFSDINRTIDSLLRGRSAEIEGYTFNYKKSKILPSGQDLYVELDIDGSVSGKLAGLFDISVDTADKVVTTSLKELVVVEGDVELELANMILGGFVTEYLDNFSGFQYGEYVKEVPKFIKKGIERGKSGDKWHPEFEEMKTKILDLQLTRHAIYLKVNGTGDGKIVVDKLKMDQQF